MMINIQYTYCLFYPLNECGNWGSEFLETEAKNGVQLFAAQKLLKRPCWWKGNLLIFLDAGNQDGGVQFVSSSWGQFSELWQAMSWLQSGHHVSNFFHMVGVSVSVRYIMVQDIILSIALEKELQVLDCM